MRNGVGEDGKVVAVIGDGALTGGVAFEALHNAGGMDLPIVIVLNDNGMSIAPNVGAMSRYFNRIRINPKLHKGRGDVVAVHEPDVGQVQLLEEEPRRPVGLQRLLEDRAEALEALTDAGRQLRQTLLEALAALVELRVQADTCEVP